MSWLKSIFGGKEPKDGDVTSGGSKIIEGKVANPETLGAMPPGGGQAEVVDDHLSPVLGVHGQVFHELISDVVHLDILVYPPVESRDYWVYVTAGMSDRRMNVPEDVSAQEWSRAELIVALPAAWGETVNAMMSGSNVDQNDSSWWPIANLKWLARYPHIAQTWFTDGHTIPHPAGGPYASDTKMDGVLIGYPTILPEEKVRHQLEDGDRLNFYGLFFLHPEEMQFKLTSGTDALFDEMFVNGVSEILNAGRDPVVGV